MDCNIKNKSNNRGFAMKINFVVETGLRPVSTIR